MSRRQNRWQRREKRDGDRDRRSKTKTIDKSYLRDYVHTFFKGFKPIEGINYTVETLSYMTSLAKADQFTEELVTRIHKEKPNQESKIIIVEPCAGIGGNTMSYLRSPFVQKVYAYEIVPERQKMLLQNLTDSGFDASRFEIRGAFDGISADMIKECEDDEVSLIIAVDPPWLPSNVSGAKFTKSQYILSGMKLGDKTLEQWLATDFKVATLTTFRMPPGYSFNLVPGYLMTETILGPRRNTQMNYAIPI